MLQQTQVGRVIGKYADFIAAYPDFLSIEKAPLRGILRVWQGLGYNRRALALKEIAARVMRDFNGVLPDSVDTLAALPGIGRATASAICAFAFDSPSVFVETNIRRVFTHFFFRGRYDVRDADILPLVERTLDTRNPREWYYALMDYGVLLKRSLPGLNRQSAHYQKQAPFQGSNRQMRGRILKILVHGPATSATISRMSMIGREQAGKVLTQLEREGFIVKEETLYSIAR